jgi:polysaccharide deacetylase family protein (PEP-CTERM system associated)
VSVLNGISFDIEDWFHVENLKEAISCDQWDCCDLRVVESTHKILRVLDRHRTHATFFILGWVAERCSSLVRDIAAAGHEIGSHGYGHELVYTLSPQDFRKDVFRSKNILESLIGKPVLGYRAPSFSITRESTWAIDTLKELGFTYDSSIFPTSFHNRYGFNGTSDSPFCFPNGLVELPLSTYNFCGLNFPVAGGGYFRLFPYALFSRLCRRLNMQGKSLVFYLHPWELDAGQPRVNVRFNYRLRHYVNLHKTEARLDSLLDEFGFAPLGPLAARYLENQDDRTKK